MPISYINIGFTRKWGQRTNYALGILIVFAGAAGFVQTGNFGGMPAGLILFAWLAYLYGHLGISLILAVIIATPDCEMRAIPHLWTILSVVLSLLGFAIAFGLSFLHPLQKIAQSRVVQFFVIRVGFQKGVQVLF